MVNKSGKKKVRTFSASDLEIQMLNALAGYHGCSKSAAITNLIKKEFWRVFPSGTEIIKPADKAWIKEEGGKP